MELRVCNLSSSVKPETSVFRPEAAGSGSAVWTVRCFQVCVCRRRLLGGREGERGTYHRPPEVFGDVGSRKLYQNCTWTVWRKSPQFPMESEPGAVSPPGGPLEETEAEVHRGSCLTIWLFLSLVKHPEADKILCLHPMCEGLHLRAELGHEKLEDPCPGGQSHSRAASFLCSRRPRPPSLRRGWVTRTLFRDTGRWAVVTLWQHFGHYVSVPPAQCHKR